MRAHAVAAIALLAISAGCDGSDRPDALDGQIIIADTIDPELIQPGTVLRVGPATEEAINRPVFPPIVRGDEGMISIYDGFFIQAPCSLPLQRAVRLSRDTITVRFISAPDTTLDGPCQEDSRPLGYSMLVGQFEPDSYAVRLMHEGDQARATPLDTVYEDIAVEPK